MLNLMCGSPNKPYGPLVVRFLNPVTQSSMRNLTWFLISPGNNEVSLQTSFIISSLQCSSDFVSSLTWSSTDLEIIFRGYPVNSHIEKHPASTNSGPTFSPRGKEASLLSFYFDGKTKQFCRSLVLNWVSIVTAENQLVPSEDKSNLVKIGQTLLIHLMSHPTGLFKESSLTVR